ncbi:hypothetical protein [Brevundimonas sp.]|uniref:hypothetical protein n=1 Tax=Brevundimonas sp. TaxID=1871086 RepID=UPI0035B444F0
MRHAHTTGPWGGSSRSDARWTPRQTLAFAFGASLLLWSVIALAVQGLLPS